MPGSALRSQPTTTKLGEIDPSKQQSGYRSMPYVGSFYNEVRFAPLGFPVYVDGKQPFFYSKGNRFYCKVRSRLRDADFAVDGSRRSLGSICKSRIPVVRSLPCRVCLEIGLHFSLYDTISRVMDAALG